MEEIKQIYFWWKNYRQFAKSPESQVSGKWWTLLFISICKFASFKKPFSSITGLSEFYFRFRRFILLVNTIRWQQHKQVKIIEISEAWPDTFDKGYTLPTWTHSQNSLAAAEAPSLKISSHGTSHMIEKTDPISTKMVISNAMKLGIPLWIWWNDNGNWDSNMIRIS